MSERNPITPNDFCGSDVERINRALEAAAGTGRRVVIPRRNLAEGGERDLWLLDSAILIPGDSHLELDNCHLKLTDDCRDNIIRSANCGIGVTEIQPIRNVRIQGVGKVLLEGAARPRATGDGGKVLGERTFATDAEVAGESQRGDWRNIGILLAHVEDFAISGFRMKDSHCWAISLERCAHGCLRDLDFASSGMKTIDGVEQTILNQDGIDLRLGCHDIIIENITGYTGDDLIALTALPNPDRPAGQLETTMVSGAIDRGDGRDDIRHVMIRNVRGYCRGGHHIVRLLNSGGAQMYDVMIDGLLDTSPDGLHDKAAVKIGDDRYGDGVAPIGDTRRIIVNNVVSRAEHTIMIGGSLCDSIISNVIRHGLPGEAVTVVTGSEFVRDVATSNIHVCADD